MSDLTTLLTAIQALQASIANLTKKLDTLSTTAPTEIHASSILLFTQSSKGTGRHQNDASNKQRELLLEQLLTTPFVDDAVYGTQWRTLQTAWRSALDQLAVSKGITGYTDIHVQAKGGRGYNYDFLIQYRGAETLAEAKVEFKFGGTAVNTLPEFFNPDANKPFQSLKYAEFFYDRYLDSVLTLYGISGEVKPTKEVYLKHVHSNSSSLPLFRQLYDAEKAGTAETYKAKAAISHTSIQEYLRLYGASTDLALLTAEFQRSQSGKTFLLYQDGVFHRDQLTDDELVATAVLGVQGDSLVVQSAAPGTVHKLLLRWKNHHCVLLPAWQISMLRRSAAPTLALSC
jgi:hypothetical protein